jgi:hypothetical protein
MPETAPGGIPDAHSAGMLSYSLRDPAAVLRAAVVCRLCGLPSPPRSRRRPMGPTLHLECWISSVGPSPSHRFSSENVVNDTRPVKDSGIHRGLDGLTL